MRTALGVANTQAKRTDCYSLTSLAFQHSDRSIEQAFFHISKAGFGRFNCWRAETNRRNIQRNLFSRSYENRAMKQLTTTLSLDGTLVIINATVVAMLGYRAFSLSH